MLLQSMSLDPREYGWKVGLHRYEPVPTLDPMAPLRYSSSKPVIVMETVVTDCAVARRMVLNVYAWGNCKGITCKNCVEEGVEYGKDSNSHS